MLSGGGGGHCGWLVQRGGARAVLCGAAGLAGGGMLLLALPPSLHTSPAHLHPTGTHEDTIFKQPPAVATCKQPADTCSTQRHACDAAAPDCQHACCHV